MSWARAAVRSWTAPGRAADARPDARRVGDDLHVDAVPLVFSAVVRPLIGDAVDRDQGCRRGLRRPADGSSHDRLQVVGGRGEQGDRLADVAPGGGHADLEAAARRVTCRHYASEPERTALSGRDRDGASAIGAGDCERESGRPGGSEIESTAGSWQVRQQRGCRKGHLSWPTACLTRELRLSPAIRPRTRLELRRSSWKTLRTKFRRNVFLNTPIPTREAMPRRLS